MDEQLKPLRWLPPALKNLAEREVPRREADKALAEPEQVGEGHQGRKVFMRRYFDERLKQKMLIRAVVEETGSERIVTTIYITSKIGKYMGEGNS